MAPDPAWDAALRAVDLRAWRCKKIFLDLDETLVEASRAFDEPGAPARGPRVPLDDGLVFEIVHVNREAVAVIGALVRAGAMVVVTSVGRARWVEGAIAAIGAADLVHGVFAAEDLAYEHGGLRRTSPKDFSPVIAALGEPSPLDRCVVIGNDPLSDVPIAPLGLVTALTVIRFSFLDVILTLTRLLDHGGGSFREGFDRLVAAGVGAWGRAELEDDPRWKFLETTAGRARVVWFDRDAVEGAGSQFLALG